MSGWYNDGIQAERYDRDHVAFGTLVFALPVRNADLPQVPAAPSATWGNATVTVSWPASTGAATYNVKRATSRGGTLVQIATGLTATNFTDTTVTNSSYYYYRVTAVNAAGESAVSGLVETYPSGSAPAAPVSLTASSTGQSRIDLVWPISPGATGYTIKRATAAAGPFTTLATGAGTTFPRYAATGLLAGRSYYFTVSATNSIGEGSPSAIATAATLPALPAGWTCDDISYQTTPARATYSGGTFTVKGAGLDYGGGVVDIFGFTSRDFTGNGEIVVRLASREKYSVLSKVGIAMRESTAGGSKHVFLRIDGSDTADMTYRTGTNGGGSSTGTVPVPASTVPCWLKLSRTGNVFTGSVSADGVAWTQVHSLTVSMASTIKVGFAVCSRNNGMPDTGVFDNVAITGWTPPENADVQNYDSSSSSNVWSLTDVNWDSSTVSWINGNKAVFGGVGETVTVNDGIVTGGMTFNSDGYNLANGTAAAITLDGSITVTTAGQIATINEILTGVSGFNKAGAGILHLRNANTHTGDTLINAGIVRVGDGTTKTFLGADSAGGLNRAMVASGATLEVSGNNSKMDRKEIRLAGNGAGGTLGALYADATGTTNGIRINHQNTNPATVFMDADSSIRIDGAGVAGANVATVLLGRLALGGFTMTKTGPGALSFEITSNGITGPGKIVVADGVLKSNQNDTFNNNFDLEIQAGAAAWANQTGNVFNSITASVIVNGTLVLNSRGDGNPGNGTDTTSATNTLGRLSGSGTITSGIWDNTGSNTLILSPSSDCSFGGTITQASGTVNLTKTGTATVTLTGSTNYNGVTTVSNGRLKLLGVHANTGNTIISAAGSLTLSHPCLSDTATLTIASGSQLQLDHPSSDVVGALIVNGTPMPNGLYGASGSGATNIVPYITGTGRIQVGPVPAGYFSWASGVPNGLTAGVNDGTGDDPDGDGIVNLLEYVLGGTPAGEGSANPSILPTASLTPDNFFLTFRRSDLSEIDTVLKVQWSTDLVTWLPANEVVIGPASSGNVTVLEDSPSASLDTVTVAIPRGNGGKLYARVVASFP
ncbi:MAG: autotransporter-associated beta strand repeat-containing protein [Luteolibacter sp.]|uniref:autotransporter-associated beta strand repeat-containing protein n=1 Tax=Luteolibacter sp. TaxID=1962973 RepID=UPI0032646127